MTTTDDTKAARLVCEALKQSKKHDGNVNMLYALGWLAGKVLQLQEEVLELELNCEPRVLAEIKADR